MRRHIRQSQSKGSFLSKIPVDATAITHDPGDVLVDTLAKNGLPQHEPEAEAAITAQGPDHGETAAAEVGGADYYAAKIFAAGLLKGGATGCYHLRLTRTISVE
jgi:hypothetical protein